MREKVCQLSQRYSTVVKLFRQPGVSTSIFFRKLFHLSTTQHTSGRRRTAGPHRGGGVSRALALRIIMDPNAPLLADDCGGYGAAPVSRRFQKPKTLLSELPLVTLVVAAACAVSGAVYTMAPSGFFTSTATQLKAIRHHHHDAAAAPRLGDPVKPITYVLRTRCIPQAGVGHK
jgi:hypothetical protein